MLDPTFHFVFSKLSAREGDALARLRFRDLVQEWMDTRDLAEPEAIDALTQQSRSRPFWFYNTIDVCIIQYRQMRASGLIPEPIRHPRHHLSPDQDLPASDSRLTTPDSRLPSSAFINVSSPDSDSRLTTPDSGLISPDSGLIPPDPDPHLRATG